jgi:cytochrome d ubiquinol oxidase subunit I
MEALFDTQENAPLLIGGIPNVETQEVKAAIEIPGFLSYLAYGNFESEVKGLDQFPRDEWPPVALTHYNFQIMVLLGMIMAAIALLYFLFYWKWKHLLEKSWWLKILVVATPLGFIAIEAGWMVTELGRQPWIIYRIMHTEEALTPMPGIIYPLLLITVVYVILTFLSFYLMNRQIRFVHESMKNNSH